MTDELKALGQKAAVIYKRNARSIHELGTIFLKASEITKNQGGGFTEWLKTYCPGISYTTAWRYRALAEALPKPDTDETIIAVYKRLGIYKEPKTSTPTGDTNGEDEDEDDYGKTTVTSNSNKTVKDQNLDKLVDLITRVNSTGTQLIIRLRRSKRKPPGVSKMVQEIDTLFLEIKNTLAALNLSA